MEVFTLVIDEMKVQGYGDLPRSFAAGGVFTWIENCL